MLVCAHFGIGACGASIHELVSGATLAQDKNCGCGLHPSHSLVFPPTTLGEQSLCYCRHAVSIKLHQTHAAHSFIFADNTRSQVLAPRTQVPPHTDTPPRHQAHPRPTLSLFLRLLLRTSAAYRRRNSPRQSEGAALLKLLAVRPSAASALSSSRNARIASGDGSAASSSRSM